MRNIAFKVPKKDANNLQLAPSGESEELSWQQKEILRSSGERRRGGAGHGRQHHDRQPQPQPQQHTQAIATVPVTVSAAAAGLTPAPPPLNQPIFAPPPSALPGGDTLTWQQQALGATPRGGRGGGRGRGRGGRGGGGGGGGNTQQQQQSADWKAKSH